MRSSKVVRRFLIFGGLIVFILLRQNLSMTRRPLLVLQELRNVVNDHEHHGYDNNTSKQHSISNTENSNHSLETTATTIPFIPNAVSSSLNMTSSFNDESTTSPIDSIPKHQPHPPTRAIMFANVTTTNENQLTSAFVVNHIMTTEDPLPRHCHRTCFDFRNRIYLSPPKNLPGAGLMDRLIIFSTLLNMAGYLCARVYVPRPYFLLHERHNAGQKLPINMTWSEFGDFTYWHEQDHHENDDNTNSSQRRQPYNRSALVEWDHPHNLSEWPDEASIIVSSGAPYLVSTRPRQVKFNFPIFENYTALQQAQLLVRSRATDAGATKMTTTRRRRRRHSLIGDDHPTGGFLWIIQAEYYEWCHLLSYYFWKRPPPDFYVRGEEDTVQQPYIFSRPTLYTGCQYAKVQLAPRLQQLRDQIMKEILSPYQHELSLTTSALLAPSSTNDTTNRTTTATNNPSGSLLLPPLVGYLHIRRQDAIRECDTSLKRIEAFLKCSLGKAISRVTTIAKPSHVGRRKMVIFFSSDEEDGQYRRDVMKLLERQKRQSLGTNRMPVMAVDLDRVVERVVRAEIQAGNIPASRFNNFYLFQLVFSIGYNQSLVHFHMEQRRDGNCKSCINVTEQIIQSGALDL